MKFILAVCLGLAAVAAIDGKRECDSIPYNQNCGDGQPQEYDPYLNMNRCCKVGEKIDAKIAVDSNGYLDSNYQGCYCYEENAEVADKRALTKVVISNDKAKYCAAHPNSPICLRRH